MLQRQNEPQHVPNPNTSTQSSTVGLAGIHNPKPITAHTGTRKVRHRKDTQGRKNVCSRTMAVGVDHVRSLVTATGICAVTGLE